VALPFVVLAAAAAWSKVDGLSLLSGQDTHHGAVKRLLLVWQSVVLYRGVRTIGVLAVAWFVGLRVARAGGAGRPWHVAGWAAAGFAVAAWIWRPPGPAWECLVPALAWSMAVAPWPLPARAVAMPGLPLILPGPTIRACLGTGARTAGTQAVLGVALVAMALAWLGAGQAYEAEVVQRWDDSRVGADVTVVARSAPGRPRGFHDLDLVPAPDGQVRAVVVAESPGALLALPEGPSAALPPMWGPMEGLVMDSETDPRTGVTWALDGPDRLVARRRVPGGALRGGGPPAPGEAWEIVASSPPLPHYVHHAYTVHVPERREVLLFGIGLSHEREPGWVMSFPEDTLAPVRMQSLRTPDGTLLGLVRDVVWVPPLRRFVLAPDMGDRFWTWDPETGLAAPWLTMPTRNGKPTWSEELGQLLLPSPDQLVLWMVDPVRGTRRAFPTQPGVRSAAVDVARDRVVTLSVLTCALLVQRLSDALPVDLHTGLRPMARLVQLDRARGEAWAVTWGSVYRVPYAR
jgi:hypothetical protein